MNETGSFLQELRIRPIRSVRPMPVNRVRALERIRLTAVAAAYTLFSLPALVLAVLTVVGWPLVFVGGVGVVLVSLAVPGSALLARVHRRVSGALLGSEIEQRYADTSQRNLVTRVFVWLRDGARWRDFAHCAFSATGGFVLSLLPPALLLAPVVYVAGLVIGRGWVWVMLLVFAAGPLLVVWWLITPALMRAHALADRGILGGSRTEELERRVEQVTASRTETLDHSAAEIRRIERDLHDGAQARIVSLGMNLGLAEELVDQDPAAAAELLRDARESSASVLEELRSLVRGIHPPVLAERGLTDAIEALTLALGVPVTLAASLDGRPPAPVETAMYFAVAECLANTAKHARAGRCWIRLEHDDGVLRALVGDDGVGGADPAGSGLSGVRRRLAAFDGTMVVESPEGGPTTVTMEVPCALSSPRTTPSSETD